MLKHKFKIAVNKSKIISTVLTVAIVVTSIPVVEFFRGTQDVGAAVTYSPKKIGVSLMCKDMLSGSNDDNVYNALTRTNSLTEDSGGGSAFNNVGMLGLTYQNRHGDAGKSYRANLKSDKYKGLYDLAKKGQIEQSLSANVKNHNHRSTKRHWNKIKQYCKIIFGYPTSSGNGSFYGRLFESNNNSDYSNIGGNGYWNKMNPDKGYKNQLCVYLTAKKGCGGCSGAYIENVSVALKDTKSPTISSITISKDQNGNSATEYFKAGQTLYAKVKFSEYVRLADNDKASNQSTNIKLGLSLGKKNTKEVTQIYANLINLKDDFAIFSYKIPATISANKTTYDTDFFISGLADITKQGSLIVTSSTNKDKKFRRVFLDNNGNNLAYNSSTMKKLKSGINDDTKFESNIKKATCAITDIAGNPVDIGSFRVDSAKTKGVEVKRTYLDAVSPKVSSVDLSSNQSVSKSNDQENHYLKAGTKLTTKIVVNEKLQNLSSTQLGTIKAKLNIYDSKDNQISVKAKSISYGDSTSITFEPVTIDKTMTVKPIATGNQKADYKITVADVENKNLLKDYSDNAVGKIGDLRSNTGRELFLDNIPPNIMVDNNIVKETDTYEMAKCDTNGEVYRIVLNTTDNDKTGSSQKPYASGVMGAKGVISVDLQSNTVSKFQYILSVKEIKNSDLSKKTYKVGQSNKNLALDGTDDRNTTFSLPNKRTYVYLYLKFMDEIDYGDVTSGIKVKITAEDVNNNIATATAKYNYTPADKIKPTISYEGISLKENTDNTAYQQAKIRIKDQGGIDINNIKYTWVKEGQAVPGVSLYEKLPLAKVEKVKTVNNKVTECVATIKTDDVSLNQIYSAGLYVFVQDVSENKTISGKLVTANIDMSKPTLQIKMPENNQNKKSSLIVNGPFTSSTNDVSMFVAIEDPVNAGNYFIRMASGKSSAIGVNEEEYLNEKTLPFSSSASTGEIGKWSYGKITKTGSKYTITKSFNLNDNTDKTYTNRLLAISGNMYYGKVNIIAGTGFKASAFTEKGKVVNFDASKGTEIEKAFLMMPDTYGFSKTQDVLADKFTVYDAKPNSVKINAKGNYGKQVNKEDYSDYNPEDYNPEYLASLAGAAFTIDITNTREKDLATENINYGSQNTYIKLKNADSGYYVYQWDMSQGLQQENITIPEEIQLENGHYALEVSIANFIDDGDKEIVTTETYDNIYVYNYSDKMTEAFGIDSVSTKIDFTAKDQHIDDERPPYVGFEKTGNYNFTRKFTDVRIKDYTSDSNLAYDTDTLYLGNCHTDTYDDQTISYERTIKFSANGMSAEDIDNYWIKVWTGDSENKRAARWFKFDRFNADNKTLTINVKTIDGFKVKSAESPEDFYATDISTTECEIPVFEGSNTVSYEIMNIGGNKSEIHQVEIMYHIQAPALTIDVDNKESVATTMSARVIELGSDLVTENVNLYETDFKGDESKINTTENREFQYTENGRHLYYAIDGYRNLAFKQFYIENIDNGTPVASFKTVTPAKFETYDGAAEDEGYMENATLEVDIKDDKSLANAQIDIAVDDRESFTVDLSEKWNYGDGDEHGGTYLGRKKLDGTGVKEVQLSYGPESNGEYYAYLYIQLNDDIDSSKKFKERINHTVVINVTDEVGHTMEKTLTTNGHEFYGLNNIPRIKNVMCEPEGEAIDIEFTGDVRVTKVNGNEVPEKLYERMDLMSRFPISKGENMSHQFEGADLGDIKLKDYFGICKDGTYEIEYVDVYNNKYKENFKVENFFGNYAADIKYSTLSKTNQNVVATITAVDKNAELSLKDDGKTSDNYTVTWSKDKTKATIEFTYNDAVTFNLKVKGAAEADKVVEHNVTVGNIDKKAPDDVKVTWVFKETGEIFEGKTLDTGKLLSLTTNNDIQVLISSDSEDIYGVGGKELSHTFTYSENMDRSYTFEYADECGNEGKPVTVTLPDELVMTKYQPPVPEEELPDTEAPSLSAEVYAVYDGMAEYKTSWNPENDDFNEIAEDIGFTGGYKIKYTLFDRSKSKIVVLNGLNTSINNVTYNSNSDNINGVKVSALDNSIVITKACSITVVAVDEAGNKVAHSFTASKFDTEKPTVTVKKVGKSFREMNLQYYLDDNTDAKNQNGTVTPVTKGLKTGVDEDGYYYYLEIKDNGTYNTVFKDKSGNKTTVATKITEIDNKAPTIKVSSWSPCYTKDGKTYEKIAPTEPVNSSVTLSLDFDKTVSELKVFYKKGDSWIEDKNVFSKTLIELGGRKGKVQFKEAVPGIVKVVAKSPNGMSSELSDIDLEGIIDKMAPKITFTQTKKRNSVEVIYKSDEKVLVTGCDYDTTYGANTNIPLTIKANGTYELTFTDMAGNITTKSITVDSIDEIPPEIYAVGIPQDYVSPKNCKIKVTMSEKGIITFQGKDYSVKAPVDANGDGKLVGDELDWITLPIDSNGSYQVKAVDEAGLVSYKVLQVKYVDSQAPNIQFNKSVVNVSQGTTVKELKDILLDEDSYILWDNVDPTPTVTIENMLTEANLNNQSIHEVKYVLKDSSGNQRIVTRYVKVISSANLKIKANGELMSSCDTTILNENEVTLTLEKSKRKGESFKVYYKEGIRKAGSMKNAKSTKKGKITNLENGFYTLYIVTQNKETYLTYLFIAK